MTDRQNIENRLRHKMREIQHLEERLREARGYVAALREVLGLDPRTEKSMVEFARDIMLERGHEVHITDILRAMGREITRESRVSLTSALSAYARRGDIFVKTGPNRFALIEFKATRKPLPKLPKQPPDDFGQMEPEKTKSEKTDTNA